MGATAAAVWEKEKEGEKKRKKKQKKKEKKEVSKGKTEICVVKKRKERNV